VENHVCRVCGYLLELFSWNNNTLKEYWWNWIEKEKEDN